MKTKYYRLLVGGLLLSYLCTTVESVSALSNQNQCKNSPYHMLVNKQNPLSKEFVPENLVMPKVRFYNPGNLEKNYMEKEAAMALEEMFNAAKGEGINLIAVSGYRSYDYQRNLYERSVRENGIDQMGSAAPNESEHRTGLAMDITGTSGGTIEEWFGKTKEGKWLAQNCYKYGYIIRYPENKTHITGYIYEPWHVRYVGKDLASKIHSSGLTMEELPYCCYEVQETDMLLDGSMGSQKVSTVKDGGTLYMSLREFVNRIGATLTYDGTNHMYIVSYGGKYLHISKDYLNGQPWSTLTIEDRLFVPVRMACERLGLQIVMVPSEESPLAVQTTNKSNSLI